MHTIDEIKLFYAKKSNKSKRIGRDAVRLFSNTLPNGYKSEVANLSIPIEYDYGLDEMLQFFENEKHTGKFCYVQIKGSNDLKYLKNGNVTYSLDFGEILFLLKTVTVPVALIVCDTSNKRKKVYWYGIQTENGLLKLFEEKVLKLSKCNNLPPNSSINIEIPKENILPATFANLEKYFREAQNFVSFNLVKESVKNVLIKENMDKIGQLKNSAFNFANINTIVRDTNTPINDNSRTLMSFSSGDHTVDFLAGSEFSDADSPIINMSFRFPNSLEYIQRMKKLQNGSLSKSWSINAAYIDKFEIRIKDQVIESFDKSINPNSNLTITPLTHKKTNTIVLRKKSEEDMISVTLDGWVENNIMKIDSTKHINQPLFLKGHFKVNRKNLLNGNLKIIINKNYFNDIEDLYKNYLWLLNKNEPIEILGGYPNIKNMTTLTMDKDVSIERDSLFEIIKSLYEIKNITNVQIPMPLPKKISLLESQNIFMILKLLNGDPIKITAKSVLTESRKEDNKEFSLGTEVELLSSPPILNLFQKPYTLQNYTQVLRGTVKNVNNHEGYLKKGIEYDGYDIDFEGDMLLRKN